MPKSLQDAAPRIRDLFQQFLGNYIIIKLAIVDIFIEPHVKILTLRLQN